MTDVVDTCRKTWKRLGVPAGIAGEMASELEAELAAAAEDGVAPEELVGSDVRSFATRWVHAKGVVRPRLRLVVSAGAALVGAVPGTGLALLVAFGFSSTAFGEMFPDLQEYLGSSGTWLLLTLYGLGALFACAGAVGGVAAFLRWREDPTLVATVRWLAIGLPFGTAAAIGLTVLFAWTQEFSTDGSVVLTEALVGAVVFALSVGAVRLAAVRSGAESPAGAG